jgi:hypothetical protein
MDLRLFVTCVVYSSSRVLVFSLRIGTLLLVVTDSIGYREMAKHPAKFIDACKRSKIDTDELAKQWLQDHKAALADTQIAFGMRLQV